MSSSWIVCERGNRERQRDVRGQVPAELQTCRCLCRSNLSSAVRFCRAIAREPAAPLLTGLHFNPAPERSFANSRLAQGGSVYRACAQER